MKIEHSGTFPYSKILLYGMIIEIGLFSFITSWYFYPWDFLSYLLNGDYLFGNGEYYEIYRPPCLSFFLFLLKLFFQNKYLILFSFIFMSSIFFIYSIEHILNSLPIKNRDHARLLIFFVLGMNPVFIAFSFIPSGTEIISISFAMLGISYLLSSNGIKDATLSGILLSLSSLTRYNFLILFPILFFHRKLKKIFFAIVSFSMPWLFWLIYNKVMYGKFLYSFIDSYFLNVYYRETISQSPSFNELLFLFVIIITTSLFLIYVLKKLLFYHIEYKKQIIALLFISLYILLTSLYTFIIMPLKIKRYIYPITISYILFVLIYQMLISSKRKVKINKRTIKIGAISFIILLVSFNIFYAQYLSFYEFKNHYAPIQEEIENVYEYIKNASCIYSDYWIYYNALNIKAYPEGFLYDPLTKSFDTRNLNSNCSYIILHENKVDIFPYYNETFKMKEINQTKIYFISSVLLRKESTQNAYFKRYKNKVVIDNIYWYSLLYEDPNLFYKVCSDAFGIFSFAMCK